jgi:predicted ATPase with chaperone activity
MLFAGSLSPEAAAQPVSLALGFVPKEVTSLAELDVNRILVESIILKLLASRNSMVAGDIAREIGLPYFNVVEPLIESLRDLRLLEVVHGSMQAYTYVLAITEAGRVRAALYSEQSSYVGPVPVSMDTYRKSVAAQSIRGVQVNRTQLDASFEGLVFDKEILDEIGPAVNSGQSMFLYGPPGNGKTAISERIVRALGGAVFVPYCVEVNGAVIRLFDEYVHVSVRDGEDARLAMPYDQRWRLIERPVVRVGGELTMRSLDLIWNTEARFYEAPFQLKANMGVFMVDDFGRQAMDPKELLNRWIVPLEKRVDYLALHNGVQTEVPFDELVVFSTNLDPKELVDEAFLRRIRYKIPIKDPTEQNFRTIWHKVCQAKGVPCPDEMLDYFINHQLHPRGKPYRGCVPRDIIELVMDSCRYWEVPVCVTPELLDAAADAYYVRLDERLRV